MVYLFAKALHVVGFVSWLAGLLYVVRLYVYDVEATARPEPERRVLQETLRTMQRRLWLGITWPAMVVTWAAGSWMVVDLVLAQGGLPGWLLVKLALLVALVLYHLQCGRLLRQLESGTCRWTSRSLRAWNEVATLLLVAIVFVAVFRTQAATAWVVFGLGVLAVALGSAVLLYERTRRRGPALLL